MITDDAVDLICEATVDEEREETKDEVLGRKPQVKMDLNSLEKMEVFVFSMKK